ncbi:gamma carbonic anhydrase family protein [uncultured Subdoligranulum sp.]|uniref:gamma carbonic anhydrase family protein n=1 Tax=uncultured Subdoligranulum sp. TaxID=512298 RepID=UPI002602915E|nr:gamma carbonic anhydrase family protein [uncultured Subdoligranulum sp.]
MSWITVGGKSPADHGAAFVAENATLAGSVRLEEGASVWYGAVLRADTGRIVVGAGSNVQDNAVLHTGPELDIVLGRGVSVGHSAVLHGCMIGDGCMIGMHATVLNGAVIGPGCLIAAGALVPERAQIPAGSLVMGVPGKVVRPVSEEQKAAIAANEAEYRELARQHAAAR